MGRHFSKVDDGSLEEEVLDFLLVSKRPVTHLSNVKSVIFQLMLTALLSLELGIPVDRPSIRFLVLLFCQHRDAEDFSDVDLQPVQNRRALQPVVHCPEYLQLHRFDLFDLQFLVRNLLMHSLHAEWINVFEFAANKHRCDTDEMQVTDL